MAEKKAILVLAGNAAIRDGSNIAKFMKKAVLIPCAPGDLLAQAEKVEGVAKATPGLVAAEVEKGTPLSLIDLADGDDAALDAALGFILDAVDRRTLIAVAGGQVLALYGQGVGKGAEVKDAASFADVIPTIAYVADVSLPASTQEGRVLYGALKDPNARLKEIIRLQESIQAMQAAIEGDSRNPKDSKESFKADKKAILVSAGNAAIRDGSNIAKFMKKAVLVPYASGELLAQAEKVEGAAKAGLELVAAEVEKGTPLALVDLADGDDAALDAALGIILDAADRRTLIAVAGGQTLALYGLGVARATEFNGAASAVDVIPTIAYVADVLLPANTQGGRVLYGVLKDPNARLKEIIRLQESIQAMQAAIERDSRAPWDKHDCA